MITSNPGLLAELNRSIVTRYKLGLSRRAPWWPAVAQREMSTTSTSIFPILGRIGSLREWVGNRIAEELTAYDFEIKNRHFEKTLRVNRDMVDDDQFGFYGNEAEMLGDAANRHPDKLVTALIEGGFATKCYDGQNFFSTTHPVGTGTGTASNMGTTALSVASYVSARQGMMTLTDDGGEILDIMPDLLVVPPGLEDTARTILNADIIINTAGTAAGTNVWKSSSNLLVVPRLADPNNWYLFDTSKVLKPFIMQFRKDPQIVSQTAINDDSVFERNEYVWGVDYRGEAGYSLWQMAFGAAVA